MRSAALRSVLLLLATHLGFSAVAVQGAGESLQGQCAGLNPLPPPTTASAAVLPLHFGSISPASSPSLAAALCQTYVMQPGEGLESVVTKFGRAFNKGESAGRRRARNSSLQVVVGRLSSCNMHPPGTRSRPPSAPLISFLSLPTCPACRPAGGGTVILHRRV